MWYTNSKYAKKKNSEGEGSKQPILPNVVFQFQDIKRGFFFVF